MADNQGYNDSKLTSASQEIQEKKKKKNLTQIHDEIYMKDL